MSILNIALLSIRLTVAHVGSETAPAASTWLQSQQADRAFFTLNSATCLTEPPYPDVGGSPRTHLCRCEGVAMKLFSMGSYKTGPSGLFTGGGYPGKSQTSLRGMVLQGFAPAVDRENRRRRRSLGQGSDFMRFLLVFLYWELRPFLQRHGNLGLHFVPPLKLEFEARIRRARVDA